MSIILNHVVVISLKCGQKPAVGSSTLALSWLFPRYWISFHRSGSGDCNSGGQSGCDIAEGRQYLGFSLHDWEPLDRALHVLFSPINALTWPLYPEVTCSSSVLSEAQVLKRI